MKTEKNVLKNLSRDFDETASLYKALDADDYSKSIWFSKRMLVAVLVFISFSNVIMLMNNLNIAVVEMTSNKTIVAGNTTEIQLAEFQWSTITIGTVYTVYWYGSLLSCFSGCFENILGGSVGCAMFMMVASILTILHPAFLYIDFNLFLVCRFLTGFFGNSLFVFAPEIYSRWYPKKERSLLTAIGYNGVNIGGAISFPLYGYIAEEFGWKTVFYVSGGVSLFISLLFFVVVKNRPSQDRYISKAELSYILDGTDDTTRKKEPHPYKKIFTSGPVLALCVGKTVLLWQVTVLSGTLPLYIKDATGKSTTEIGFISSIPVAIQIIVYPIVGAVLDAWNSTTNMPLTLIHKITIGSTYFISSIFLLVAVFVNDYAISIILIILAQIIASVGPPVYEPINVNISPNDCTVISGLAKIVASIGVIVARTSVGYMTVDHTTQEWNNCFLMTAGVLILGAVLFITFASSEAQPWSSCLNSQQERRPLVKISYRKKSSS